MKRIRIMKKGKRRFFLSIVGFGETIGLSFKHWNCKHDNPILRVRTMRIEVTPNVKISHLSLVEV